MQRRNCNKAYCMTDKNRRCAGSGAPAVFQKSVAVPVVEHFAEIAVSEGFAVDEEVADAAVTPHDLVAVVDGSAVDLEEQRVEAVGIFHAVSGVALREGGVPQAGPGRALKNN